MSAASGGPAPQRGLSRVRLAIIGFGAQGGRLAAAARSIPGARLAAAADLYDGRLERAREVAGDALATTKDYRQILERRDVDAVIIATPDHWHVPILAGALAAGKDVYCEAPVIHRAAEHWPLDIGTPVTVTAAGALHPGKDGREVPGTLSAPLVSPEQLIVSVSGSLSGSAPRDIRVSGTDASLVIRERELVLEAAPQAEPYTDCGETWPQEYRNWFYMMHGMTAQGQVRGGAAAERTVERFRAAVRRGRGPSSGGVRRQRPHEARPEGRLGRRRGGARHRLGGHVRTCAGDRPAVQHVPRFEAAAPGEPERGRPILPAAPDARGLHAGGWYEETAGRTPAPGSTQTPRRRSSRGSGTASRGPR